MEIVLPDFMLDLKDRFYNHHIRNGNFTSWRGIRVVKYPQDLLLYAEAILANHPDWIIEIGTRKGGSATFFADMIRLVGGKGVISIDIKRQFRTIDPMVTFIEGDSLDHDVMDKVRSIVSGDVMISIHGCHRTHHVKRELRKYGHIVTPGQYMVAEDCYIGTVLYGPGHAVNWFLSAKPHFKLENPESRFMDLALTRGGWLRKCRS